MDKKKDSIVQMYMQAHPSENQIFGIKDYNMPVNYFRFNKDSIGQIGNLSMSPKRTATKKPPWINLNLKEAGKSPSSAKYAHQKKWPEKDRSDNKQNKPEYKSAVKKITFVDILQKDKHHIPPPNKYDTRVSDFKPKSKIFSYQTLPDPNLRREFFVDDILNVASKSPGPGQYNPHHEVKKIRPNTKDYKYWIEKHKSSSNSPKNKKGKDTTVPDMGTYTPIPANIDTFARTWASRDKFKKPDKNFLKSRSPKKENSFPHTGFGLEKRFKDTTKESQKKNNNSPGPQFHNTIAYWPGKQDKPGGELSSRNVYNQISKGPQINIYYK